MMLKITLKKCGKWKPSFIHVSAEQQLNNAIVDMVLFLSLNREIGIRTNTAVQSKFTTCYEQEQILKILIVETVKDRLIFRQVIKTEFQIRNPLMIKNSKWSRTAHCQFFLHSWILVHHSNQLLLRFQSRRHFDNCSK